MFRWYKTLRVRKQLLKLVDVADNVADGNLNVELDPSAMDEISTLADSFQRVIDIMGMFVSDLRAIDRAFRIDGNTSVRLDVSNYKGTYREVATAINDILEYHVMSKSEILECMTKIVNGQHDAPLRQFPGKESQINEAVDNLRISVRALEQLIKQKAEAESASNAKSTFLANMSHEIRTPMNAILGATELLMVDDAKLTPELRKGLLTIYNSGSLLLGIINDILDLSKIEAGKLDILPGKYKLASLINDSVQLNALRIDNRVIDFEVLIDENIPAQLIGDELRIKQILNNLLSNAFKYTDAGKVTLKVDYLDVDNRLAHPDSSNRKIILLLSVSDTGHGMTPRQIDGLFVEYARYNQEVRRTIEGTGLGLSITKHLIDLMGGTITVTSQPEVGSDFVVKLPQEVVGDEVLGHDVVEGLKNYKLNFITEKKHVHISRTAMPYAKVLIVDDVEANLYVAEGMLKLYKMQIDTALSGTQAIELVKAGNTYDVIFMDHMMPVMDGIEAAKIIRDTGYTGPIVALTANAVSGQEELFRNSGFDDFIPKPIDTRVLNSVVNRFIRDTQIDDVIESARWQSAIEDVTDDTFSEVQLISSSFLSERVDGLNIIAGLEKLGNDEGSYRKTLNAFVSGIGAMLQSIADNGYKDLETYRVCVHGIKGACFDIFADNVGQMAQELETAAKANDITYIDKHNTVFLDAANTLISDIEHLLIRTEEKRSKPFLDMPKKDLLIRLRDACDAFDMYNAEAVMDEIEHYIYKYDDGLAEWLREKLDIAKFKEISERLKEV